MHPVLLAFYFFAFLSLVVSKPYDISLSAGADFCSSCKCGDLAECRTQCDKCLGAPGKDHTLCDYCKYPGCKDNCLCWSYCARTGLGCPLRRGNCVSDELALSYSLILKADMMASTHRILSAVVIVKCTVYVKILLSNIGRFRSSFAYFFDISGWDQNFFKGMCHRKSYRSAFND